MIFKVVSVHFTKKCNLYCPFCYRGEREIVNEKPREFFIELIKYIKGLAPQIALGGGEPLVDPEFVKQLGIECKNQNIILNFTTNGKAFLMMTNREIVQLLKDITMISISFDKFKWGNDINGYARLIKRIKAIKSIEIGTNLLIDSSMFQNRGLLFAKIVKWLFEKAIVDRVFALYPKNTEFIDILKYKAIYQILTYQYPMFFVDDLTKQILEQGYDWEHPCHYGKMISIDEKGYISGCSFENNKILKLERPSDLLKIKNVKFEKRIECPFINIPEEILKCY